MFTFNRAGLTASEQSALSYLAKEVVMQHPLLSNPGPAGGSLGQTGNTLVPATIDDEAVRLRAELTAHLRERGSVRTPQIAEAFAAVARHLFVPDAPLSATYADEQVFTKHTDTGVAISACGWPARCPTIRLARNDNRETLTGQFTIDKTFTRLAISWR